MTHYTVIGQRTNQLRD